MQAIFSIAIISGCMLGVTSLAWGANPAGSISTIKCWTNEDGVRECGTVMPPQYAPQGHQVLSPMGTDILREVEPQKSAEEIERLKREEAEARAQEEAEKKRLEEGKALLDAYPTESDINLARDGKLASVDAAIKVAQNQIEFFNRSLAEAEKAIGNNPSEDLEKHIMTLKEQITKFESIVQEKYVEQDRINANFDDILQKYRDYKEFLVKSRGIDSSKTKDKGMGMDPTKN